MLICFQKLNLKISSLQKLIEQLRAEIKEKGNTITELEEKLKAQVNKYNINKYSFGNLTLLPEDWRLPILQPLQYTFIEGGFALILYLTLSLTGKIFSES